MTIQQPASVTGAAELADLAELWALRSQIEALEELLSGSIVRTIAAGAPLDLIANALGVQPEVLPARFSGDVRGFAIVRETTTLIDGPEPCAPAAGPAAPGVCCPPDGLIASEPGR